jgi:hypothetical protein
VDDAGERDAVGTVDEDDAIADDEKGDGDDGLVKEVTSREHHEQGDRCYHRHHLDGDREQNYHYLGEPVFYV